MFADGGFCLPNFFGIVGGVNKERDWQRLARYVRAARGSRSQKAIADAGGPSHTTQGKIERGEWTPSRGVDDTIEKLETVYSWAPGSIDNILAGGEPEELATPLNAEHLPKRGVSRMRDIWGRLAHSREDDGSPVELDHIARDALSIWRIWSGELEVMPGYGVASEVLAKMAAGLADRCEDLAKTLFDAIEGDPSLRERYGEAYAEVSMARRRFLKVHDDLQSAPSGGVSRRVFVTPETEPVLSPTPDFAWPPSPVVADVTESAPASAPAPDRETPTEEP